MQGTRAGSAGVPAARLKAVGRRGVHHEVISELVCVGNPRGDLLLALREWNTRGHHPCRVHRSLKIDCLFFVGIARAQGEGAVVADLDVSLRVDSKALCGVAQHAIRQRQESRRRRRRHADGGKVEVVNKVDGVVLVHVIDAGLQERPPVHDIA